MHSCSWLQYFRAGVSVVVVGRGWGICSVCFCGLCSSLVTHCSYMLACRWNVWEHPSFYWAIFPAVWNAIGPLLMHMVVKMIFSIRWILGDDKLLCLNVCHPIYFVEFLPVSPTCHLVLSIHEDSIASTRNLLSESYSPAYCSIPVCNISLLVSTISSAKAHFRSEHLVQRSIGNRRPSIRSHSILRQLHCRFLDLSLALA